MGEDAILGPFHRTGSVEGAAVLVHMITRVPAGPKMPPNYALKSYIGSALTFADAGQSSTTIDIELEYLENCILVESVIRNRTRKWFFVPQQTSTSLLPC